MGLNHEPPHCADRAPAPLSQANPKLAEDTTKRVQALLAALDSGTVSARVLELLRPLVAGAAAGLHAYAAPTRSDRWPRPHNARRGAHAWAAVRDGQFKAALDLHVPIMTMHYEEAGTWIVGLKRLLALSAEASAA